MNLFKKIIPQDQSGQALSEYIIIVLLVSCVAIGAIRGLSNAINARINDASKKINSTRLNTPSQNKQRSIFNRLFENEED